MRLIRQDPFRQKSKKSWPKSLDVFVIESYLFGRAWRQKGITVERLGEMGIGERLRRVRERAGMSQGDVAVASGVGAAVISRYERDVMTPGWKQIEKILAACDATPCDLFEDYCVEYASDGSDAGTFAVNYYDRRPHDPDHTPPDQIIRFRKNSPMVPLLGIAAADGRYAIIRAISDIMIPDIYPGDLMVSDTTLGAAGGRVVAGYIDGEPLTGRLVRHQGNAYIVPSNRRYPPVEYTEESWDHRGCIIFSLRDLTVRFMGGKEFIDESSDVLSVKELRKLRGGAS
jgi:transcriptional regulator with XRE-family HTH domain